MATRRSRNKLERRAHMNIHDTVEVADVEAPSEANTRDRLGREHRFPDGDPPRSS